MLTKIEHPEWEQTFHEHFIAQRSHLYSLKPVGLGTANVESLTSYITNLAKAHWISVGDLLSEKFSSVIGKEYLTHPSSKGLHQIYSRSSALNGFGIMAQDWVNAAQSLTLREDLHFLTLLAWFNVLPSRQLLRHHRAWCPICYESWKLSGQPLFDPLVWAINVVTICPDHHAPLSTQCPYCFRVQPFLDWRSQPGHCSKCGQWLGKTFQEHLSDCEKLQEHEARWQLWVVKNVGELLAIQIQSPKQGKVAEALSIYIKEATSGNIAEFARMLDLPKNTVWQWQAGQVLPPLRELLRICQLLSIPLTTFLIEDEVRGALNQSIPISASCISCFKEPTRKPIRTLDLDQIYTALETELLKHSCPPSTLKQVAANLGFAVRLLREHFPIVCCAIAEKARAYRRAQKMQRVEILSTEVRQVVLELRLMDVPISQSTVSKYLNQPGAMRDPQARLALQKLQLEIPKNDKGSTTEFPSCEVKEEVL